MVLFQRTISMMASMVGRMRLSISNSTINGMITSQCMTAALKDGLDADGTQHAQYDRFSLSTADNSTINDTYEHYAYDAVLGKYGKMPLFDIYMRYDYPGCGIRYCYPEYRRVIALTQGHR